MAKPYKYRLLDFVDEESDEDGLFICKVGGLGGLVVVSWTGGGRADRLEARTGSCETLGDAAKTGSSICCVDWTGGDGGADGPTS